MHFLLGYSIDNIDEFVLNLTGIASENPYCIKQAEPIIPEILIKMAEHLDFSKCKDRTYWCLFLFAIFQYKLRQLVYLK